jgi:hypothetical protein
MSIYITQQKKEELKAKMVELINNSERSLLGDWHWYQGRINMLNDILNEAIVLPVEESWESLPFGHYRNDAIDICKDKFSDGVIIKPKES